MPRIRSVHPDICNDEVLPEISAYAERTWVRLWTQLDDKGRGPDNAKLWAGLLYPLHDDVTPDRVERDLSELEARGLILRYEVDGRRWLCAKPSGWSKYQKPQHPTPSKIPGPPEPLTSSAGGARGVAPPGVEGSCIGEEGESEGEARNPRPDVPPVDNPHGLEAKAERIIQRFQLVPGGDQDNPAETASVVAASPPAASGGSA